MARGSGISGLFVYLFVARSFACFGLTSYCNKVGRRLASRISEILMMMPIFYLAMLTAFFYSCIFYLFVNKHYLYSSACFRFSGNQKNPQFVAFGILQVKIPSICRLWDFWENKNPQFVFFLFFSSPDIFFCYNKHINTSSLIEGLLIDTK